MNLLVSASLALLDLFLIKRWLLFNSILSSMTSTNKKMLEATSNYLSAEQCFNVCNLLLML
jgi:hypothetical protein